MNVTDPNANFKIGKFWWFWLPLIFLAVQACIEIVTPKDQLAVMMSESGPHELIQFIVIALAFIASVILLFRMDKTNPWRVAWVFIAAICCLYVAGEEASWGQHILQWDTPEYWAHVNDQNETNFHNTSSWLDQKPRLILLIGIILGGFALPLVQKWKPSLVPARFASIYPPPQLMAIAACLIVVYFMDNGMEAIKGHEVFERSSEIEELYMFYFVLLYIISLYPRFISPKS